jgi:hypothetical protein
VRGGDAGWRYRLSIACESNLAGLIIHTISELSQKYLQGLSLKLSDSDFGLRCADDHGASARQFFVGDFRYELQVKAEPIAFPICHIVEKVNYVSAESVLGAPTLVEVEWARRIYFQFPRLGQDSAELPLEIQRSLPHLRHGESYDMV